MNDSVPLCLREIIPSDWFGLILSQRHKGTEDMIEKKGQAEQEQRLAAVTETLPPP